jgi:hypothetical protein
MPLSTPKAGNDFDCLPGRRAARAESFGVDDEKSGAQYRLTDR